MISRNKLFNTFYIVFFLAMYFVYYKISQRIPINSDMASGILEGIDVAKGNIFLKGWSLSTVTFYFTDIAIYAIIIKIFGFTYKLSYIVPSVILSLLCIATVKASENKIAGFLVTFFFVGSPVLFLANSILVPVIHVGTYLYCVCAYLLILGYLRSDNRNSLVAYFFVMALTFFSDGMAVCLILLPSMLAAVFNFLFSKKEKGWYTIAAVSVVAFVASRAIWALFRYQGFDVPYVFPTSFASVPAIWTNFSDFIEGFIRYSGGYFFGLDATDSHAKWQIIGFACAALFFFTIIARLVRFRTVDCLDVFLLTATLIMPLAFCTSSIASGITSVRYIVPSLIFGSILVSRKNSLAIFNVKVMLVAGLMLLSGSVYHVHESLKEPKDAKVFKRISQDLSDAGLKHGFADFWFSSSISIYGQVQIAPVHYDYQKFTKMNWLSKSDWYDDNNNFVIINDEGTKRTALKSFGEPSRIISVEGKEVYIWDKGIKAY